MNLNQITIPSLDLTKGSSYQTTEYNCEKDNSEVVSRVGFTCVEVFSWLCHDFFQINNLMTHRCKHCLLLVSVPLMI
jgi:hypothetical protein